MNFWFRIGAENGDPVAQQNYSSYLIGLKPDDFNCRRAAFWLNESRRCFGDSIDILLLYDELSAKCPKK
jgi:hypothetical protein